MLSWKIARYSAVSALSWLFAGKDVELARPRVQFICLHYFPPFSNWRFRKLLAELAARHTFIGYSEAVRRVREGAIDRPYIAFSSDDGFASDLVLANVLEEFGARACFFVCPVALESPDPARFCVERLHTAPQPLMTWNSVDALLARGHEIGSHSSSHADLTQLSRSEMEDEILPAREILKARCGAGDHFAWPFGRMRQFNRAAGDVVFRAGHVSCASAIRGCHVAASPSTSRVYLWRDPIEPFWPVHHSLYFLARNSRKAAHGMRVLGVQHAAA